MSFKLTAPPEDVIPYVPDFMDNRDRQPHNQMCFGVKILTDGEATEAVERKLTNRASRRANAGNKMDGLDITNEGKRLIITHGLVWVKGLEWVGRDQKVSTPKNGAELLEVLAQMPNLVATALETEALHAIQEYNAVDQGFLLGAVWQRGSQMEDGIEPLATDANAAADLVTRPDSTAAVTRQS